MKKKKTGYHNKNAIYWAAGYKHRVTIQNSNEKKLPSYFSLYDYKITDKRIDE